jgi:hypoxia up-regulated 1
VHSQVLAERHYPIKASFNETRKGIVLKVDGEDFTPEELVAMVLTHAVDISVAYAEESGSAIAPPKDCVLTVPMFATQHERRALLDAAALAELNVLGLIDETTAAALHYAMDKTFETEQLFLFYNMGAASLQVSLIRFYSYDQPQKYGKPKSVPALEVLSKAWNPTLGGLAFDHLLVEYLADQFNEAWEKTGRRGGKDVRSVTRAMTKIRIQANKVKHVLSANMDIPVHMEAVHDDVALTTQISRQQLEDMAEDLLKEALAPVDIVLAAANKTAADLTQIELIGGGMRIPRIQTELQKKMGSLELGLHINADESMALGAAFAGANASTAFRVRHVGLTDISPFSISVSLSDLGEIAENDEAWSKSAVIFKANGKVGVKKTIAFTHDRDIVCGLDYTKEDVNLPAGTERSLERYNITGVTEFAKKMAEKDLGKPKVSLQFELDSSGVTSLVKAEAVVEETYTVQEEIEVDDKVANANSTNETVAKVANETATNASENATNETAVNTTKGAKPKRKMMLVEKVSAVSTNYFAFKRLLLTNF